MRSKIAFLGIFAAAPALFALLNAAQGREEGGFTSIPPGQAALYHVDFARNYFPGRDAEKADRARLRALLSDLETLRGKSGQSAANLEPALEALDRK